MWKFNNEAQSTFFVLYTLCCTYHHILHLLNIILNWKNKGIMANHLKLVLMLKCDKGHFYLSLSHSSLPLKRACCFSRISLLRFVDSVSSFSSCFFRPDIFSVRSDSWFLLPLLPKTNEQNSIIHKWLRRVTDEHEACCISTLHIGTYYIYCKVLFNNII